jgi:hypothetical protein
LTELDISEKRREFRNVKFSVAIVAILLVGSLGLTSPVVFTSVTPEQVVQTQTGVGFSMSPCTVAAGHSAHGQFELSSGVEVGITWSADAILLVYIFNSSEWNMLINGATFQQAHYIANQSGQDGSLGFTVAFPDTYTVLVYNPNVGTPSGTGVRSANLYELTGTEATQNVVTVYSTR